jgi:catalase
MEMALNSSITKRPLQCVAKILTFPKGIYGYALSIHSFSHCTDVIFPFKAHIEKGGTAEWTMKVQVMQPEDVATLDFDPFDVTKIWPRSRYPMQEVGRLVLNRNPEDYHRDVEQAAFSPGSLVPGIQLSPDSLLQWRAFLCVLVPT